jgi:hypothetical protein
MKVNQEQITYIETYISSFDIRYYEIYMEILDHIILSVEAILEEDKTISFEKAVLKAKVEGFGSLSFNEIVEDRMQIMNKANRKQYGKHLKSYFTFPYFLMTLGLFLTSYLLFSFFENPRRVFIILTIPIVLYSLIDWTINQHKYKKKNNRKVFKMENFRFVFSFVFVWFSFSNVYFNFEFDKIMSALAYNIGLSFLATMSIVTFLFYINWSKKITKELQQQIFA